MPGIDIQGVRRKYRGTARIYDVLVRRPTARLRARAIARIGLAPGSRVLDFGCGTGLSFEGLADVVGARGEVVGVDVSPEMLAHARDKIRQRGWTNVTVIESNVEEVGLEPGSFDGVLCFYTHDIMRSPVALQRAVAALRPGGCVVAAGAKLAGGWWGRVVDPVTTAYSRTAITNFTGFDRPWTILEPMLGGLEIETCLGGTAYLARGLKRG